ncbi:MAG: type II toxin-antitoxin system VapC family toxin [Candidatus Tyrphobacter sp.]
MIVDTSALVAILHAEPDALAYAESIEKASTRRVSAVTFAETAIVIDIGRDPIASRRVDDLIREARITVEPVTEVHARLAREAYRDFGKGSGHRAGLNFGDCFSYALSKATGEPLLFKGRDFSHTDVLPARA